MSTAHTVVVVLVSLVTAACGGVPGWMSFRSNGPNTGYISTHSPVAPVTCLHDAGRPSNCPPRTTNAAWMTPGIHPSSVRRMLRKKLAIRPVIKTANGGSTMQKKYRSAFISSSFSPLTSDR